MQKRKALIFILIAAMLVSGCMAPGGEKESTVGSEIEEEYAKHYAYDILCLTEYAQTGMVAGDGVWEAEQLYHYQVQEDGHGLAITAWPGGMDASGSTYGILYETADGGKNWNLLDSCFAYGRGQSVFVYMGEVALIAADNYKVGYGDLQISYDRGHSWEVGYAFPDLIDYDYEKSGSIIPSIINYNEDTGLITFGWDSWFGGEGYELINQFDVREQRFVQELYRHPDFVRAPLETEQEQQTEKTSWEDEVSRILSEKGRKLGKTAVPMSKESDEGILAASGNTRSRKEDSVSYPFVRMCSRMAVNPIAVFRLLAREGLYVYTDGDARNFTYRVETIGEDGIQPSLSLPVGQNLYQWDLDHGTLIKDIMKLAGVNDSAVEMEAWIASEIDRSSEPYVFYSPEDACYYAYFMYYGEATAHILCMYLRTTEAKGINLNDVEFQLLSMRYLESGAAGGSYHMSVVKEAGLRQAAALITAIEQLMTGTSAYATAQVKENHGVYSVSIPAEYTLGDYQVTISQSCYETQALGVEADGSGLEQCTLVNYRIQNVKSRHAED